MGAAGTLILGFSLPARGRGELTNRKVNAWISITQDNRITLFTETPEMGQGTRTANAMMLAEELEADWSVIHVEQAPTVPAVYKHLTTGGSDGAASTWLPLRQAGAQARELLVRAAAEQWNCGAGDCRAESGSIIHISTGRRLRYGDVVEAASKLTATELSEVRLKTPKEFRIAGKSMPRVDTPAKVDGSAIFGLDIRVPGMLFAVIARCPHFGGKVTSFDTSDAEAVPGVKAVFAVPSIGYVPAIERNLNVAGGIAVVATSTWAASHGRKALNLTWDKGAGASESTASLRQQFQEKAAGAPTVVTAERGNYLAEAYQVAKRMKVPVQVMRTREDDIRHDFYLQYSYQRLTGAIDGAGNIIAWSHRTVSTPIRSVFDSPDLLRDPKHGAESLDSIPYETPNYRSDYARASSVVPRAWWRSVSSPFQVFAVECFVDELAYAAGKDPLEFRLEHLRGDQADKAALRRVLQAAAEKSDWGKPLPASHGRGIAGCRFGDTYVAHVAEVLIDGEEKPRVHRVVSAIDCGFAVKPDNVRAQIEGGINFALTPVLSGEISVREGAIEQSNFDTYQVLRMKDAPDIEVHLLPGEGEPRGGVGESGVPPLAPAVANAIFAATGKRVRRLPILRVV